MSNYCILLFSTLFIASHCNEESPSILVIGSGASGIAAATKLWKNNFTNLKILEAEDYIGGRIKSVKFGEGYAELGAQAVLGDDNIVYEMVKQYDILKETKILVKISYSNGEFIDEDLSDNLIEFGDSLMMPNNNDICQNISSIEECFKKEFKSTLAKKYEDDAEKLKVTLDSVDFLESYILTEESSLSLSDISTKSSYKDSDGYFNWQGLGFKTIIEVLLQQYPDSTKELPVVNNILLNKEVSKIIWSNGTAKNSVQCSDNTVYEADYVIFTPSLGVLKSDHEKLFEPKLPDEKVTAIGNIGFGSVLTIILHFNTTWWNPDNVYAFIWSAEDKKNIAKFDKGPIKNGRSWLTTSIGFITVDNNPKALMLLFSGEMIPEMEKESNEVLRDGCMYMFRKFLGEKYSIVEPDNMIKSTWHTDRHFRGCSSYESVKGNDDEKLPEKLAAPLNRQNGNPSVLFAGEATHRTSYGSVHGAIESGYREADRIINIHAHK